MALKERQFSFTLLGQEYSVVAVASDEEMNDILALVKNVMEDGETARGNSTISINRKAVLACLTLASRYLSVKSDFERFKKESAARSILLAEEIEVRLKQGKNDKNV